MKRLAAVLLATLFVASPALADFIMEHRPPLPTDAEADKIEVIEFFRYGCIHCYNLQPRIEPWAKKLPVYVQFKRVPAVFNSRESHDASIFYAFEALGVVGKLHRPFFDAIHRDGLRTDNQAALGEWLKKQGVDPQQFTDTMKSFGVQSKARRAARLTVLYKPDGTPAMGVHGRYTLSPAEGPEMMLETAAKLAEQIRKGK